MSQDCSSSHQTWYEVVAWRRCLLRTTGKRSRYLWKTRKNKLKQTKPTHHSTAKRNAPPAVECAHTGIPDALPYSVIRSASLVNFVNYPQNTSTTRAIVREFNLVLFKVLEILVRCRGCRGLEIVISLGMEIAVSGL